MRRAFATASHWREHDFASLDRQELIRDTRLPQIFHQIGRRFYNPKLDGRW